MDDHNEDTDEMDGIEDAERGHQLARRMDADLEAPPRHPADLGGQHLGGTEQGVQAPGKAGRQPPADGLLGVDRRSGRRRQDSSQPGVFDEGASLHRVGLVRSATRPVRLTRRARRIVTSPAVALPS